MNQPYDGCAREAATHLMVLTEDSAEGDTEVAQSGRRWNEGFWTRPPPAASGGATLRVGLGVPVALAACREAIDGVGNLTYTKVQACDTKPFKLYLCSLPLVAAIGATSAR